jgi:hypothetical protein
MLKILEQPYPHSDSNSTKAFISLGTGFFIALFLIYFEPFSINELTIPYKTIFLTGYGIVATIIMFIFYFIVPFIFPNYFKEENWTVGRDIFSIILNVSIIAFCNVLYCQIIFWSWGEVGIPNLLKMVSYTFILGIFPTVGIVVINYIYYLKQYSHPPQPSLSTVLSLNEQLTLIAENEKDSIIFSQEDLFYIESNDNYSTVIFQKEEQILKELIRSSLIRLENQIPAESIVRFTVHTLLIWIKLSRFRAMLRVINYTLKIRILSYLLLVNIQKLSIDLSNIDFNQCYLKVSINIPNNSFKKVKLHFY